MRVLVSRWFGTFLVDDGRVVRGVRAPHEVEALVTRIRSRRTGSLTPEDEELLGERGGEIWYTADRRLAAHGATWAADRADMEKGVNSEGSLATLRDAILLAGQQALEAAWDPSIHVEEAVRAEAELDRVRNLIGERVSSWAMRDAPELTDGETAKAVRFALEPDAGRPLGPRDPALRTARRRLAELYRAVEDVQAELHRAVVAAAPTGAPNLSLLLGPELAARLLAQAGGLDRLARLPASTVQVLGAERAFFEHLRGHGSPPRHGILFLHPAIQSAPRADRGKLARALAGKAAIAARLDRAGAPVDVDLARAFESRRASLAARRGRARTTRSPRPTTST